MPRRAAAPPLITVTGELDPHDPVDLALQPTQDAPHGRESNKVDQSLARQDAARLVALWLRGRSFALGLYPGTNLAPALELFQTLRRAGFEIVYVGRPDDE